MKNTLKKFSETAGTASSKEWVPNSSGDTSTSTLQRKKRPKLSKCGDYEKRVYFEVWSGYTVHIVFSDDLNASFQKRYGRSLDRGEAQAFHRRSDHPSGHSHLFFKIGDCSSGTIAHECWHAVHAMLTTFAGVDTLEDEVVAYHLGYLVQQVSNFKIELIDFGIGVKSNNVGGPHADQVNTAQGSIGVMPRMQSQPTTGDTRETSQTTSDVGHCCP